MTAETNQRNEHWLSLCYQNRRLLMVAILMILSCGFAAFTALPRMEDPRFTVRFGLILTSWPGASAEKMETLVSDKIERNLDSIEEIDEIISRSRTGVCAIQIVLKDSAGPADVDEIWSRVRDKLNDVAPSLPQGTSPPELTNDEAEAYTTMVALTWPESLEAPVNHNILGRLGEELEDRLRQVAGTEHSRAFGKQKEELLVEVSPQTLTQLGLTTQQIADKISQLDIKAAAGQLVSPDNRITFEVSGEIEQLDRLRNLPILRNSADQLLRLEDIASISKHTQNPPQQLAYISGRPAVVVAARMQHHDRVDQWTSRVNKVIDEFKQELSHGIELKVIFEQNLYTADRLSKLTMNFLFAVLAVMLVVFVMMGWRSALIIGIALPLSALLVLAGMDLMKLPIHQMSISGLIIALGLLIDNAIVIVDETRRRIRDKLRAWHQGEYPEHKPAVLIGSAIAGAVGHLAIPLLGSTLTTIFSFMPIALMPGPSGEFVGGIALSVILAVIGSFLLSLTVIPALAGILDTPRSDRADSSRVESPGEKKSFFRYISHCLNHGIRINWLANIYRHFLTFILKFPIAGVMVGVALPCAGFLSFLGLKEQFFPPSDRDQFQVQFYLPRHSNITSTSDQTLAARRIILEHESVSDVHLFVGAGAPLFYYNLAFGQDQSPHYAQAMVQLKSHEGAKEVIHDIQARLNEAMPQIQSVAIQLEQGPPFDAPIELHLRGPDLDVLSKYGEEARRILSTINNVEHTRSSLVDGSPKILFNVNEQRAQNIGLNNRDIARQLQGSLDGSEGGSMIELSEELNVRIRVQGETRGDLGGIAQLPINLPDHTDSLNSHIPYEALGDFKLQPELTSIERRDGIRTNAILGHIRAGVLPSTVQKEFAAALAAANFNLPDGYEMIWRGEAGERDDAVGNLLGYIMVLMVLMVATLVLSLESYILSMIIGTIAGLSMGLGMGSLWLFEYPFGFMGIVGCMGLMGVAINDSIVVMIALRENKAACEKDIEASVAVVMDSTRHVISTTVTTVAGFIPLLLSGGGFWPPVAVVIGGGVLGATLLALTLVPSTFIWFYAKRPKAEPASPPPERRRQDDTFDSPPAPAPFIREPENQREPALAGTANRLAFVTGASGFVGLNVIKELKANHWDVIAMDLPNSDRRYLDEMGVTFVGGDITNKASILAALPDHVDAIFHIAGMTSFHSKKNELQTKVNVEGTRNMTEAALEKNADRFIHLSSVSVFGFSDKSVNEQTPSTVEKTGINYFISKSKAEKEVLAAVDKGLDAVIINPGHILGPYDRVNWASAIMLIKQNKFPGIGNGGGVFCHSADVAKILLAAYEKGRTGERYCLGSESSSYQNLVETFQKEVGGKVPKKPVPTAILKIVGKLDPFMARLRSREPNLTPEMARMFTNWMRVDDAKARKELGYQSPPLSDMVKDLCDWMRQEKLI